MLHSLRWRIFLMFIFVAMSILIISQVYINISTERAFSQYVVNGKKCANPIVSTQSATTDPAKSPSTSTNKTDGSPVVPDLTCLYTLAQAGNIADIQTMIDHDANTTTEHLIVVNQQKSIIADSAHIFNNQTLDQIDLANLLAPTYGPVVIIAANTSNIAASNSNTAPSSVLSTQSALAQKDVSQAIAKTNIGRSEQNFNNTVKTTFITTLFMSGFLALLLAFLFSSTIIKPIKALTQAARAMEQGNLKQSVRIRGKNEIAMLGHSFNTMAESLVHLEQLRRNMVSDVAHELRTPLMNIRGYLEGIIDQVVEPTTTIIKSLYEESLLLTRLVNDLQELSQAEAGQLHLHYQPTNIREVVQKAVHAIQPQMAKKGITINIDMPDRLPDVEVDDERIGQVLRNLLSNAITHTPSDGHILIGASFDAQKLELYVKDNGVGIEHEHISSIFERFYRTDASRSRTTGGSGLGLAIVKQLIEAHSGTISVTSTPGQGSCFTFTLPLLEVSNDRCRSKI